MIRSPNLIIALALSKENVRLRLLSMSSQKSRRKGINPHCRFRHLRIDVEGANAKIGQSGRFREISDAVCPVFV